VGFDRIGRWTQADGENQIIGTSDDTWDKGVELYDSRVDKRWSLTDCISFVVMKDEGISDALTGDHRFVQAGFNALLL
jgi:hypothetical protein